MANKSSYTQSDGFSCSHVWMWMLDCKEGWVPKNWCFWISILKNTLKSPLDSKGSNQSFLKEINPDYSLEGVILKMKLQYFGHVMWRASSLEKKLMLGKIEGRRRRGHQRMRWLDSITDSIDMNLSNLLEIVEDRGAWHAAVLGVTKCWTQLSYWTIKTIITIVPGICETRVLIASTCHGRAGLYFMMKKLSLRDIRWLI